MFENRRHSLLLCNPTMADYPGNLTCNDTQERKRFLLHSTLLLELQRENIRLTESRELECFHSRSLIIFPHSSCNTTYVNIIEHCYHLSQIFHESMIYTFLMNRLIIYLFIITLQIIHNRLFVTFRITRYRYHVHDHRLLIIIRVSSYNLSEIHNSGNFILSIIYGKRLLSIVFSWNRWFRMFYCII